MEDPIALVDRLFRRAGIRYVLIGAHAVNVWLEPRFTRDVDITVEASAGDLGRLAESLAEEGLALTHSYGQDQPSGPDFLRFVSHDERVVLELQTAKTTLHSKPLPEPSRPTVRASRRART